jgi:hypothetical protein
MTANIVVTVNVGVSRREWTFLRLAIGLHWVSMGFLAVSAVIHRGSKAALRWAVSGAR